MKKLNEVTNSKHTHTCCICGKTIADRQCNNPWPLTKDNYGKDGHTFCCGDCNARFVIPARVGDVATLNQVRHQLRNK